MKNKWRCNICNRRRPNNEAPAGFIGNGKVPVCKVCVKRLAQGKKP